MIDWTSNFLLQYYKKVLFTLDLSLREKYSTMDSISFHRSFLQQRIVKDYDSEKTAIELDMGASGYPRFVGFDT